MISWLGGVTLPPITDYDHLWPWYCDGAIVIMVLTVGAICLFYDVYTRRFK